MLSKQYNISDINASFMLSVGTILKDTYRIESFLSSGGFGNTYVATNFTFNEKVAVKEFFLRGVNLRDGESTVSVSNPDNRALFNEQLEKFRKEAQRIRRLRSPHVVRVHDLFDANGTAYYVMDYIDGESLAARLRRTQQPLAETEAMRYFGQVLDALEAIHAAGLCHMDLKPDNVMVDKEDNAVLIDFGASKRIASDQLVSTVTGVSYTNGYAPPEQLESDMDIFGPWTDIYALGAMLYKLLTNHKPPMPSAIYSDPTPDKSKSLPFPEEVSEQSRQLVRRLMTVVWHERPQSVADVRRMMTDDVTTLIPQRTSTEHERVYTYEKTDHSVSQNWLYVLIGFLFTSVLAVTLLLINKDNSQKETSTENLQTETMTAPVHSNDETKKTDDKVNDVVQKIISRMVEVECGSFLMGATSEQIDGANDDEFPVHSVTLSTFSIANHEVTQEEWETVMGSNPSRFRGACRPVDNVSWYDCQAFINKLNTLSGKRFRLPTEAEWEFAARGGNRTHGYTYSGSNHVSSVAWYASTSGSRTHDVCTKSPNELGIFDIGWNGGPDNCRVANRDGRSPGYSSDRLGLRLAL